MPSVQGHAQLPANTQRRVSTVSLTPAPRGGVARRPVTTGPPTIRWGSRSPAVRHSSRQNPRRGHPFRVAEEPRTADVKRLGDGMHQGIERGDPASLEGISHRQQDPKWSLRSDPEDMIVNTAEELKCEPGRGVCKTTSWGTPVYTVRSFAGPHQEPTQKATSIVTGRSRLDSVVRRGRSSPRGWVTEQRASRIPCPARKTGAPSVARGLVELAQQSASPESGAHVSMGMQTRPKAREVRSHFGIPISSATPPTNEKSNVVPKMISHLIASSRARPDTSPRPNRRHAPPESQVEQESYLDGQGDAVPLAMLPDTRSDESDEEGSAVP